MNDPDYYPGKTFADWIKENSARTAHEANRSWCAYNGDFTQPVWDEAPEWQKTSALNGVNHILENPDAGDDASHNSWMAEKVADGWVYGTVKDPDAKEHPCIVPYSALPPHQQFKDALFRTVVLGVLKGFGLVQR